MEIKGKRADRPLGPVAIPGPMAAPQIPGPMVASHESVGDIIVEPATGSIGTGSDPQLAADVSPALPAMPAPGAPAVPGELGRASVAEPAEYRAALTQGLDTLGEEMAALARGSIEVAARTAIDMLAVRTLSDAVAVNLGFARASFDHWIGGSARVSELGARFALDTWQPLLTRLGKGWSLSLG